MISLPQFQKAPPTANCGSCTACCIAPGQRELGKPFYARCYHLKEGCGCGIYETRPADCRTYRCAWHLGLLGERTDRRPDECKVLFQFICTDGKWFIGMFELAAGASNTDRAAYLRDIILTKKVGHLAMADPPVQIYPYGADVPVLYSISPRYAADIPKGEPVLTRQAKAWVYQGKCREILKPTAGEPQP